MEKSQNSSLKYLDIRTSRFERSILHIRAVVLYIRVPCCICCMEMLHILQERANLLLTRYSQRWAKDFLRKRLDWAFDATARMEGLAPPVSPRHLTTARCPCQYIEEHLFVKLSHHQRQNSSTHCSCLTRFCQDAEL